MTSSTDPRPSEAEVQTRNASTLSRRSLAKLLGAGVAASALPAGLAAGLPGAVRAQSTGKVTSRDNIPQSVCKWCYPKLSLAELATAAKEMGLKSVELVDPRDFSILKEHGVECAMVNSHPLHRGLAHKEEHEFCLGKVRESIAAASDAGYPSVITFSGMRKGIPDDVGLENSVKALKKVVGLAEKKGVTICMELLNSKVDHPDYMCDHTAWGVELVERVGSERFKLLYDIYHMQIMEGDVIRTITDNIESIGHFHTAGVPGRNEMNESQELFYPAIVRAIVDAGYTGYLGQEFIPTGDDPIGSLRAAAALCDV